MCVSVDIYMLNPTHPSTFSTPHRAPPPRPPLRLYEIFVYFEAVVHEATILSIPPPTCVAHAGAQY